MVGQGSPFNSDKSKSRLPDKMSGSILFCALPLFAILSPVVFSLLLATKQPVANVTRYSANPIHSTNPSYSADKLNPGNRVSVARVSWEPVSTRLQNTAAGPDPNPFQLKFTWGGGNPARWKGSIGILSANDPAAGPQANHNPKISNLQILSYQSDAPGSIILQNKKIQIHPTQKTSFYSFQASISNLDIENDQIEIDLQNVDSPKHKIHKTISIKSILKNGWNSSIDDQGRGVWIQRTDGDAITIHSTNKQEIFDPGNQFQVRADVHLLEAAEKEVPFQIRLVSLLPKRQVIWKDSSSVQLNGQSFGTIGPFTITAEPNPGVYQLEIEIEHPRSDFDLFGKKRLTKRAWQWIVAGKPNWLKEKRPPVQFQNSLDNHYKSNSAAENPDQFLTGMDYLQSTTRKDLWGPSSPDANSLLWQLEGTDLENGSRSRFSLSRVPRFPRFWPSEKTKPDTSVGLEILPGKSHSINVEIPEGTYGPAVLEITRSSDASEKLAVWWLENSAEENQSKVSGQAGLYRSHTSWDQILLDQPKDQKNLKTTRRIVWLSATSRHNHYRLTISNESSKANTRIDKIQLYKLPGIPQQQTQRASSFKKRDVGHYLDVSGFFDSFQSKKTFSAKAGQAVSDWQTFFLGSLRLVDFAKRSGASNIWLPIRTQGGSLYPSRFSPTSARSDDSIFNGNSQQNDRLDTFGLLLKDFHRNNLKITPILDLSGTSHVVEQHLHSGESVRLAYPNGYVKSSPKPVYNALHPKFQDAVLGIVNEIGIRYGNHPALNGLGIRLTPESNLLLPGAEFPLDLKSFREFLSDSKIHWPKNQSPLEKSSPEERFQWVMAHHQETWLHWKSAKLSRFYAAIQKQFQSAVRSVGGNAENGSVQFLFDRWQEDQRFHSAKNPQIAGHFDWKRKLLEMGLDTTNFQQKDSPKLVFSWRQPASESFLEKNRGQSIRRDTALWGELKRVSNLGVVSGLKSEMHRIQRPSDSFTGQSKKTYNAAVTFARPKTLATKNWAQALWHSDARSLAVGGWGMATVDQPNLQGFSAAFRGLPDQPFRTIYKDAGSSVVLREFVTKKQTFRYMVNAAPWPVDVTIKLNSNGTLPQWKSLVSQRSIPLTRNKDGTTSYAISLPPFSMLSASCSGHSIKEVRTQTPRHIVGRLKSYKDTLFSKLRGLQNVQSIGGIENPGFEETNDKNQPKGWSFDNRSQTNSITVTSGSSHTQKKSLHLRNNGKVLWIRSVPIPVPSTGRLSLTAWIKAPTANQNIQLRVSIDGQLPSGNSFYRYAEIAKNLSKNRPGNTTPSSDWKPVVVHFDGIPSDQLQNLRVGFDLFGKGEILIDSVQIFDMWIETKNQKRLANRLGLAAYSLESKNAPFAGYQLLDHYWIDFLNHYGTPQSAIANKNHLPSKGHNNSLQPIIKSATKKPSIGGTRRQSP